MLNPREFRTLTPTVRTVTGKGADDVMVGDGFRAGAGRVVITPPLNAPHAGWGAQTHIFPEGVDQELWATVLVVTDGNETAAFVDLDLVIISRAVSDAIRAGVAQTLGIPTSAVRCSVTHNHAGPPPDGWDWATNGMAALRHYYASLPAYVGGAARVAMHQVRPARIAAAHGQSQVAVNRREIAPSGRTVTGVNPGGRIDPRVLVVRIDGADGFPLAAIAGYTMHPTTMGPTNRLISPDWPGYLKRTVERLTGATCLFAQGATGDIGPGPAGFTSDLRVIQRLGGQIGAEVARVYLGMELPARRYAHERIWESGAPLGTWRAEVLPGEPARVRTRATWVELPLREQPEIGEAEQAVRAAQERLTNLRASGAPAAEIEAATFVAKRANMALERARTFGGKRSFPIELHLLQIGPIVFAGAECEPFSETGETIRAGSPFPFTWFGGYTGGWFNYVPTASEYPRGGYEVDISPYSDQAANVLAEQTIAALRAFAAE